MTEKEQITDWDLYLVECRNEYCEYWKEHFKAEIRQARNFEYAKGECIKYFASVSHTYCYPGRTMQSDDFTGLDTYSARNIEGNLFREIWSKYYHTFQMTPQYPMKVFLKDVLPEIISLYKRRLADPKIVGDPFMDVSQFSADSYKTKKDIVEWIAALQTNSVVSNFLQNLNTASLRTKPITSEKRKMKINGRNGVVEVDSFDIPQTEETFSYRMDLGQAVEDRPTGQDVDQARAEIAKKYETSEKTVSRGHYLYLFVMKHCPRTSQYNTSVQFNWAKYCIIDS